MTARIEELQETLRRIDDFESTYRSEPSIEARTCFAADPRFHAGA
ncbi:MAG: hypothetical protein ACRDSE_13495 [Pseudonocardiaceae bacterium]